LENKKVRRLEGEMAGVRLDEDGLTMAVGATLDCLNYSRQQVDGLFFLCKKVTFSFFSP
jgi:hypothetical protein